MIFIRSINDCAQGLPPVGPEKQYDKYLERLNEIFDSKPNSQEGQEAELLVLLIENYEDQYYPIDTPDPIVAVRIRMEELELKQKVTFSFLIKFDRVKKESSGPVFLLMDEPTNHLDLESITALNNAIKDFKGNLIMTSHDHQLLQTGCNRIIEITPNGIIDRLMDYDDYIKSDVVKAQKEKLYGKAVAA